MSDPIDHSVVVPVSASAPQAVKAWSEFPGHEAVRHWATEMQAVLNGQATLDDWSLVGRGIVIVNSDTSYCRELLRCVALETGMALIVIAEGKEMLCTSDDGYLTSAPALVYLEPGEWHKAEEDHQSEEIPRIQKLALELIGNFNPSRPTIYVTSAKRVNQISKDLLIAGGFDRYITLPEKTYTAIAEDVIGALGAECVQSDVLENKEKLGKLLDANLSDDRELDLIVLYLRRLHRRVARPLKFVEIVDACVHNYQEEGVANNQPETLRRQTAYHEAGHALVAMLDSDGRNIPEFTSIVPSVSFGGIVVESYEYHCAQDEYNFYWDFRHTIRIGLAGRVAEEIQFGGEYISSSSAADLERATRYSMTAFCDWGFAPQMNTPEQSSSNLAVVIGKASPSEMLHIETLVREFLAREYLVVRDMLLQQRTFLDTLADKLMATPMLDQGELSQLFNEAQVCQVRQTDARKS